MIIKTVEFKTNKEYADFYESQAKIVKEILYRISIGQSVGIILRNMDGSILDIDGDIEINRYIGFTFSFGLINEYISLDLATQKIPFTVVETEGYKLLKKWQEVETDFSYVEWLENKILKEV